MKLRNCFCLFVFSAISSSQILNQQITGANSGTHAGVVFLTHDDIMDDPTLLAGTYGSLDVINFLSGNGIPDACFMVGCHISGQPLPYPTTSMCSVDHNNVPFSALKAVYEAGCQIHNHTFSHIPFSYLASADVVKEVRTNQLLVDSLNQTLGLKLLRCPGLDCTNATVINAQPDLEDIRGPILADVGGGFFTDNIMSVPGYPAGSQVGGDWWFYQNNLPPEMAGYYYVRDIIARGAKSGVIVLLHLRTEYMTGADGDRGFPLKLIQYILSNLPPQFTFAPLDGIPGLLGNIHAEAPQLLSTEFGSNQGQGPVVFGKLTGNQKMDICKAVNSSVHCKIWVQILPRTRELIFPDPPEELSLSSSWYDITDPDWTTKYSSKFWLQDVNGDGKADLITPSKDGYMVGLSNGTNGFLPPVLLRSVPNLDHDSVRFSDINGDNCPDMITRGPTDVMVSLSDCQGGFKPAQSWSKRFSDNQNFNLDSQNRTFSVVKIAGKIGIAAGLFTGGIVFQEADATNSKFGQYRYILDNNNYSGDPNFNPQVYASDLVFADLYGESQTIPIQVRPTGLYASRVKIR